jgi:hypothetical protein
MRERRERLTAVRFSILRVIFLAEAVLAMESSFSSSGDADGPAQPEIGRRIRLSGDGRDAARAKARPLGEAASIVSAMRRVNAEDPGARRSGRHS